MGGLCGRKTDREAKYEQLVAKGKAPKQAITAVMRKLVVLANALLRAGHTWRSALA
jgi:transposase